MHQTELSIIRSHKNELERRLEIEFESQLDRLRRLETNLKSNFARLKAENEHFYMDQVAAIKSNDKNVEIVQEQSLIKTRISGF